MAAATTGVFQRLWTSDEVSLGVKDHLLSKIDSRKAVADEINGSGEELMPNRMSELEATKSEIQKWHSAFQNEYVITTGCFFVTYMAGTRKSKEKGSCIYSNHCEEGTRDIRFEDAQSAVRDLRSQLKPPSMQGNRRTPDKFVGKEAIITSQSLNGWYNAIVGKHNLLTFYKIFKASSDFKVFVVCLEATKIEAVNNVQVVENGDVQLFKKMFKWFYYGSVTTEFATESLLRILQRKDSYEFYNGSVPTDFATEYIGYGIKSVAALQRK
ncbi:hypothetical protein LXL04_024913 [Taraxacum kok-saghyz]